MLTLAHAAEQIRTRRLSPVELTRECLSRIERLNPVLNAFITVTGDLALDQARQAEAEVMAGNWRGPLHGIPIGLKDLLDTAGIRTTAGSNQFRERVPAEDAALVRQLKAAGAVIVGKLNLHEFAFGMSGVVSAFGPVKNPWDIERITGGSSSGSAAAVATGMCVASIGTDTAGSIRCPSALCGIVGLRPSAGTLSAEGMIPLARSFDTAGTHGAYRTGCGAPAGGPGGVANFSLARRECLRAEGWNPTERFLRRSSGRRRVVYERSAGRRYTAGY